MGVKESTQLFGTSPLVIVPYTVPSVDHLAFPGE
jgi:hypothetical protein